MTEKEFIEMYESFQFTPVEALTDEQMAEKKDWTKDKNVISGLKDVWFGRIGKVVDEFIEEVFDDSVARCIVTKMEDRYFEMTVRTPFGINDEDEFNFTNTEVFEVRPKVVNMLLWPLGSTHDGPDARTEYNDLSVNRIVCHKISTPTDKMQADDEIVDLFFNR